MIKSSLDSPKCIFCLRENQPGSEEHILPKGLVGEPVYDHSGPFGPYANSPLVLSNGEVCRECNNDLGSLDSALLQEWGLFRAFWNRSTTRSGGRVAISLPALTVVREGPELNFHVSVDGTAYTIDEQLDVRPRRPGAHSGVELVRRSGSEFARVTQRSEIHKRVVRAIHKIAFEMVCFRQGHEHVLSPNYNDLRKYILTGRGHWTLGLEQSDVPQLADGLPMPPRITISPQNSLTSFVTIWLGQWFHVLVARRPRPVWPGMLTIDPRRGSSYLTLSFDLKVTRSPPGVDLREP